MKNYMFLFGVAVILLGWNDGVAQETAVQPATSSPATAPAPQIPTWGQSTVNTALLKSPDVNLRPIGPANSVAIFGGGSVYNESYSPSVNLDPYVPGLGDYEFRSNDSTIREVVGARFGHTWDPSALRLNGDNPQFPFFVPRAEAEILYAPYETKGPLENNLLTDINDKVKIDSVVISLLGTMHLQVNNWFHPYLGLGLGGAYMHVASQRLTFNNGAGTDVLRGEGSDFVFVPQGLAGVEFDVTHGWSLFGEYKYLYYIDPTFQLDTHTLSLGNLGQNIVVMGLRYSF